MVYLLYVYLDRHYYKQPLVQRIRSQGFSDIVNIQKLAAVYLTTCSDSKAAWRRGFEAQDHLDDPGCSRFIIATMAA